MALVPPHDDREDELFIGSLCFSIDLGFQELY